MTNSYRLETSLVRGGYQTSETGSSAVPIYQTAAYRFQDTDQAADLFALKESGYIYSRLNNPTNTVFEERATALEGGVGGLAFSSGHGAIVGCILNLCCAGDEIISSSSLYGGTYNIFAHSLRHLGIETRWAKQNDLESYRRQITEKTRAIYAETIGNPRMDLLDIEALAKLAHEHRLPLIVDNTFAPYIVRPIEFGADIVIHSATKFIGGHGTSIGGIVIDSGNFDWTQGNFPLINDKDPSYHDISYGHDLGNAAFITRLRTQILRDYGACLSPFHSFLFLQGLETLHLRIERHSQNALTVAKYLEQHPLVEWVCYPGSEQYEDKELAQKYLSKGAGALLAFGIRGGLNAGKKFIDHLQLISLLANVGDTKSLVIHPASTTHSQLNPEQLKAAGVSEELVRLSIGIENVEDIIADIEQALANSQ